MRFLKAVFSVALALWAIGCSQDVPQAHKGRMFDRTGVLALFAGGDGFEGPILGPGTHFTGYYDEVRMVDCSQVTVKETLSSLTKDGVQFSLDVYTRFSGNSAVAVVEELLQTLAPDKDRIISPERLYQTFIRPAIGEATRTIVSPYLANDINLNREKILQDIRFKFLEMMNSKKPKAVEIHEVNLSNMDFPDQMDTANTDRAVQTILKDKAIVERDKVEEETRTAQMKIALGRQEGLAEAAKIDEIGASLRRNPEYKDYYVATKLPEIYKQAGEQGNLILAAPNANVLVEPRPKKSN